MLKIFNTKKNEKFQNRFWKFSTYRARVPLSPTRPPSDPLPVFFVSQGTVPDDYCSLKKLHGALKHTMSCDTLLRFETHAEPRKRPGTSSRGVALTSNFQTWATGWGWRWRGCERSKSEKSKRVKTLIFTVFKFRLLTNFLAVH